MKITIQPAKYSATQFRLKDANGLVADVFSAEYAYLFAAAEGLREVLTHCFSVLSNVADMKPEELTQARQWATSAALDARAALESAKVPAREVAP